MTIYATNERPAYGKQNYTWYEYRLEHGKIVKYKCRRQKIFYGDENVWEQSERAVTSWVIGDPEIPEWLERYIP